MAASNSTTTVNSKDFIEASISKVKAHFASYHADQATLKVLADVGDSPFVVKFTHLGCTEISITLQVSSTYDLKHSVLIVRNGKQSNCDTAKLDTFRESLLAVLNDETRHNYSDTVLIELFTKAFEFIDDNFVTAAAAATQAVQLKSGKKKSKTGRKSGSDEDENNNGTSPAKLCSMKTAGDVVNRIQWDTEIDQELIIVGYTDRFLGLKECLFSTFDWGDIVLADLGALAIPEHRINYFKYKGEVVWDKSTRLDNVFGSTGSGTSIYDVIKRMESVKYVPELEAKEEVNRLGRVKQSSKSDYSKAGQQQQQADQPNYFVSIPITNVSVKSSIDKFAAELTESSADVASFIVPGSSLHLTVCTLRINNSTELALVKSVMESLVLNEELVASLRQVNFKFQGVGEFYDKVVFVKCAIERVEVLRKMRETLLAELERAGVSTAGNYYEFVPHLTVLKISQSALGVAASSKNVNVSDLISKQLFGKYDEFMFGEQSFECFELSKMVNIFSFKTYPVEFTVKIN